jgi:nitrite reductase/ring-hydroxylating ferredoxin subunit
VIANPARPGPGEPLCALAEIADPGARGFTFREGEALFAGFVVRQDGEVRGYEDRCPHAGMPLALTPHRYLTREGDLILCVSHGALFRPVDGMCVGGPCAGRALTPWPVRLEGGDLVTA